MASTSPRSVSEEIGKQSNNMLPTKERRWIHHHSYDYSLKAMLLRPYPVGLPRVAGFMSISQKLGENIKKIRTRKKMSQGDICRALDMDRGYMSAIENGKKNITISQFERSSQALGVLVDKLLKK